MIHHQFLGCPMVLCLDKAMSASSSDRPLKRPGFASESLHLADVDFRENFAWGASMCCQAMPR